MVGFSKFRSSCLVVFIEIHKCSISVVVAAAAAVVVLVVLVVVAAAVVVVVVVVVCSISQEQSEPTYHLIMFYLQLKKRKRQLMSTICGHVFCDKCIRGAVQRQNKCPTCRKRLSQRQLHPLFI